METSKYHKDDRDDEFYTAFYAGFDAFNEGVQFEDCVHMTDDHDYNYWMDGWLSAKALHNKGTD